MNYFEWNNKIFDFFFNKNTNYIIILTASRRILSEISQEDSETAFINFKTAIKNGPLDTERYHYDEGFNIIEIAYWLKTSWRNNKLYYSRSNQARLWIIDPNYPPPYLAYLFFLILEVRQNDSSYWSGINKILEMPKLGSKDGLLILDLLEDLHKFDSNFYFQNIYPSGAWLYVGTLYSQIPITLEEEKLTIARLILGGFEKDQLIQSNGEIIVGDDELISIFNSYSKPNLRKGINNLLSKDDNYRSFVEDYFINEFKNFSWDINEQFLSEVKISETPNEVKLGIKIISDTFTGKKTFQLVAAYHDEKQHDQSLGEQLKVGKDILTIKSIKTSNSLIIGELNKKHIEDLKSKMLDVFLGPEISSLPSFKEKKNRFFYYHSSNFFLEEENFHNTNRNSFYLMTVDENITEIEGSKFIRAFDDEGIRLFEFSPNLSEEQFTKVQLLLGVKGLGKISLMGEFLLDRRKKIVDGYPYYFEYTGPIGCPELFAITEEHQVKIKLEPLSDQDNKFILPIEFSKDVDFRIIDNTQGVRSPKYCYSNLDVIDATNLTRASKDKDGKHEGTSNIYSDFADIHLDKETQSLANKNNTFFVFFKEQNSYKSFSENDFNEESLGNKLLAFLGGKETKWSYVKDKLEEFFPEYLEKPENSSLFYLLENWRDLGYLDFDSESKLITTPPPTLLFTQSEDGVRAFLSGFRDARLVNHLKTIRKVDGVPVKVYLEIQNHDFLPQSIFIHGEYSHIERVVSHLKIDWNELDYPIDGKYISSIHNSKIYQLKCLLYQHSVLKFRDNYFSLTRFKLKGKEEIRDDHKKEIFNVDSLKWEATTKKILEFGNDPMLVRYKDSGGFTFWYVYRINGESYVLPNYQLCLFSLLALKNKSILLKRKVNEEHFDLLVPFGPVKLPYWINKCLVLLKAKLPSTEFIGKKAYSKYEGVHIKFLNIISEKLEQEIEEITV
ncbi:hypothetical protein [Algoriphagus aquimarinus]|uniref:Uncharacterized protein n=1 Tax=Algoriphagus aquimarinus TaxID=237018 RepID=A0A5C7ASK0_9BACT|nr:hypothetical protein [Algoriphagus aquimarinus]TXE11401.1 hypothetical protein ESV85_10780 [Algoriphagus aquimarinus]